MKKPSTGAMYLFSTYGGLAHGSVAPSRQHGCAAVSLVWLFWLSADGRRETAQEEYSQMTA